MSLARLPPAAPLLALFGVLAACDTSRPIAESGSASTVCTACHGDAARLQDDPLVRAAPPVSLGARGGGAHLVHLRGSAFRGPLACGECHDVPATADHTNGVIEVPLRGVLARARGAAPSWKDPTCSSVYCHGATLVDGPAQTPDWFGGTVACGSCHGAPPANHDPSSTNCNACHPGTVKPDGTIDVANGLHINGQIDVNRMHPDGWKAREQHGFTVNATGFTRCQGCHGKDLNGGSVGVSCNACHAANGHAGWATDCTFCHGDRTTGRRSPPVDTQGRSDPGLVSVGVHASHVGATVTTPLACAECHPSHTSVLDDPTHIDGDGRAEVVFGALARTGGAAATYTRLGPTDATCSSVYCHGAFTGGARWTPSWTSTAQATCTSCHGAPPSTGRHDKHGSYLCAECHGHSGSGPTHVNGTKNVPFSPSAPGAAWSPATMTCGTFTCHGESHSSDRRWNG
jgi:predicted CxxxxCH...CXXCH cytochrome family protein